jgi:hypothetical protein
VSISANEYLAARSMAADAAAAELARAFRDAGISWMLLKGPAIARRLYDDGTQRPYSDVDALVHPDEYAAAESILDDIGYERVPYSTRSTAEHASPWRKSNGAEVDLHRSFAHLNSAPSAVWSALSRDATSLRVLREDVPVPALPALALIVALHALHHAGTATKPSVDLERACRQLSLDDWRAARALGAELGAERNLAAALSLEAETSGVAAALGLPRLRRWEITLRSGEHARLAAALGGLGQGKGPRARMSAVYREIVPDRAVTEVALQPAYGGSSAVLIRVRRFVRVVRKLPVAILAWWVQRRDLAVRHDRDHRARR